jgi:uncharacterized UBP type Zn finger protein
MPAEADLLCEYFISSNLKKINKNSSLTPQTKTPFSTSAFTADSNSFETIDFIKYEKNPMDYLKSKYRLLNKSSTDSPNAEKCQASKQPEITNAQNHLKQASNLSESCHNNNWSKLKKTGIGLLNLGNNCYLNATLQCLAYTPPFSQWLVSRPHSPNCRLKRVKGFCSLCEVEKIICDIFGACNGCAKPNSLCMNIKSKYWNFMSFE